MPTTISVTTSNRTTALAAAGGYCRTAVSFDIASTTDALCPPLMIFTTKKSPMTRATTKIEPMAMPVFDRGTTISRITRKRPAPASTAASITAGSIRAMELKIGTIMNSEEMDIGDHHREIGEQQELQRLVHDAERDQRLIEDPVSTEKRDPRDHANDVRRPEGNGADQEQGQLQQERADMEDQEIGDGETDDEREGPHDDGVLERVRIQRIGQAGPEQLEVVGEDERRDDVELVEVEEADGHDQHQRDPEEHQQQAGQGRHEEMVAAPRPRHFTPRRTRSTYEPCS